MTLLSETRITARQVLQWPVWRKQRQRLETFRDRHRGARCFIIGNGPSISSQDLTLLRDEITFVTNHFLQHSDLERINPTFYCASDPRIFIPKIDKNWLNSFDRLPQSTTSFLPVRVARAVSANPEMQNRKVFFLNYVPKRIWEIGRMSADITRGVYTGDTIVIDFCLPLAHFMGIETVYLLGCDTNYGLQKSGDYSAGYFYDVSKTTTERQTREYHLNHWYNNVTRSYEIAKNRFEADGRQILNATEGGQLEVFDRTSFSSLVAANAMPTQDARSSQTIAAARSQPSIQTDINTGRTR